MFNEYSDIIYIISILFVHFIADFILQTNKMAMNKSKSNYWLSLHVSIYTIPFVIFGSLYFLLYNWITHFVTDYVTSRWTSKVYNTNRHLFFVIIGLDQFIHSITLIIGYFVFIK